MLLRRDEREEGIAHLAVAEVPRAQAVLEVHEPVANVVRGLDEKGQGMARPPSRAGRAAEQAAVLGHARKVVALALVKAEFFSTRPARHAVGYHGLARVLRERAERGVRELQAAGVVARLEPGDQPEALRVALIAREIRPLRRVQFGTRFRRHGRGLKPMPDRVLARVSEWRIAQIVRESGGRDDLPELRAVLRESVPSGDQCAHPPAQRAPHARDLQRVREPRPHVVVVGQRKDLRLVLEPTERRGKSQPVRVAPKLRPRGIVRARLAGAAEPLRAEKLIPVHAHGGDPILNPPRIARMTKYLA